MERSSTMSRSADDEIESPVDDPTYNLLQTLTSKLEAIDAYRTYEQDAEGQEAQIFRELAEHDRQAAERLLQAVKERLARR
jgi:HPt (histidine-containing phosphotransfer) domain-containing protein